MRLAPALLALILVLVGGGCGSETGAATPALAAGLERVDTAAVADDPQALSSAVAGLMRAVDDAETAGDLDAADADQIRAAARALLDAADDAPPTNPSEPKDSTTRPSPSPDTDEEEGPEEEEGPDEDQDDDREEEGHGQGKGKGKDKGKAKGHDKD